MNAFKFQQDSDLQHQALRLHTANALREIIAFKDLLPKQSAHKVHTAQQDLLSQSNAKPVSIALELEIVHRMANVLPATFVSKVR